MKFLVTRDTDPAQPDVAIWPANAEVSFDEEGGFWEAGTMSVLVEEMPYKEFAETYGLHLNPGEFKIMERVVHWIVEEE